MSVQALQHRWSSFELTEEVDGGNEAGVEHAKVDVCLPSYASDRYGGNEHDDCIAQEVRLEIDLHEMITLCLGHLRKVKIQLLAEDSAAIGVLTASGAYSEGSSHGIASIPTAKKKLNRKSITEATIPEALLPLETVPASTDMQQHMPMTANSINLRRPSLSKIQIGGSEDRK